jgi:pyruvate/2-oxoglutarate dehydrogenase complex dihydrolipoamide acyltransferase (E2) component
MIHVVPAPRINPNDDQVQLVIWHVASGSYVEAGQDIADVETSKAVMTLAAQGAGYVDCLLADHTIISVGTPLFRIADSLEELRDASKSHLVDGATPPEVSRRLDGSSPSTDGFGTPASAARRTYGSTRCSPAAARLLAEHGRTVDEFPAAGLITVARARELLELSPVIEAARGDARRFEQLSLAKRAEVNALTTGESGNVNSMLTVQFDSSAIRARLRVERLFDGNPLPLVLYELAQLLKLWPQFTAFYRDERVHYYDRIDLGLAMDLGKGLKVVTIKAADALRPVELFERTLELGARYLENRLGAEELIDSTVTVTDLSGYDILHFHPLINGHQSAIVGVGGDRTQPGKPMCLHMTFDHRVSNGREVALFLTELRSRIVSYAGSDADGGEQRFSEATASPITHAVAAPGSCDRCGVEAVVYRRSFRQDAYLLAYFRDDGTLGAVCHRCFERWS